MRDGQEVVIGGLITTVKHHVTARGKKMAFCALDTLEGPIEITIFNDLFEQKSHLLVPDAQPVDHAAQRGSVHPGPACGPDAADLRVGGNDAEGGH